MSVCITRLLSARLGLTDKIQHFIDKTGLPYATMFMDKKHIK